MFRSILFNGPDSVKYMAEKLGVEGESRKSKPANCAVVFMDGLTKGKVT